MNPIGGIHRASGGQVVAHVIRVAPGAGPSSQPQRHDTTFQAVYGLEGWISVDCRGQGEVRLEAGECVHQPPGIVHRELGHSDDLALLEIVMPGGFGTEVVDAVGAGHTVQSGV